jgi:hypothetical protein
MVSQRKNLNLFDENTRRWELGATFSLQLASFRLVKHHNDTPKASKPVPFSVFSLIFRLTLLLTMVDWSGIEDGSAVADIVWCV